MNLNARRTPWGLRWIVIVFLILIYRLGYDSSLLSEWTSYSSSSSSLSMVVETTDNATTTTTTTTSNATAASGSSPSSNFSCHYEDAIGHFEQTQSQSTGGKDDKDYWKWISDEEGCPTVDYLKRLFDTNDRKYGVSNSDGGDDNEDDSSFLWVMIGDSLDRNLASALCRRLIASNNNNSTKKYISASSSSIFEMVGSEYDGGRDDSDDDRGGNDNITTHWTNQARIAGNSLEQCSDGRTTVAHFKIFGMHQPCENKGLYQKTESRHHNSTAERLAELLPYDLLYRLFDKNGNNNNNNSKRRINVAMIGSCLWDLSQGCNNQPTMDLDYLENYRQGIIDNYNVLRDVLGFDAVLWRTCPPLTRKYSNAVQKLGNGGRTRPNQQALNRKLKFTVKKHDLGITVDWWKMILNNVPEDHINMKDGRHYGEAASLAFTNMFLNALFHHHPELETGLFRGGEAVPSPAGHTSS